ncbi:hypothetical protein [Azorhizobium oxalatiphilum]|nr:hypothetical protein [Azorhizobium oxalatiphilum]
MFHEKDHAAFKPADPARARARLRFRSWRNWLAIVGLILFVLGMFVRAQWTSIQKDLFAEEQARCVERFAGKHSFLWLKTDGCLVLVDGKWIHESQMPKQGR